MPDLQASAIKSVQREVSDIANSGKYYITPELSQELNNIQTGLNHLSLDSNLSNKTVTWGNVNNGSIYQSLGRAGNVLSGVKGRLDSKTVGQMQANQIRAAHHQSMQDLINLREEMSCHSQQAKNNIDRFSDHIGVTDRYTGYRNNLTRGSRDPFKLDSYWIRELNNQKVRFDESGINRGLSAPQRSTFSQYQTTQHAMRQSAPKSAATIQFQTPAQEQLRPHTTPVTFRPQPTKSIQEACGINTTYPGKTEYMTRYNQPPSLHHRTSDFKINPIPDYHIYGRPIAKMVYEKASTEYQNRYEWPDGRKIIKLPWLRQ